MTYGERTEAFKEVMSAAVHATVSVLVFVLTGLLGILTILTVVAAFNGFGTGFNLLWLLATPVLLFITVLAGMYWAHRTDL